MNKKISQKFYNVIKPCISVNSNFVGSLFSPELNCEILRVVRRICVKIPDLKNSDDKSLNKEAAYSDSRKFISLFRFKIL